MISRLSIYLTRFTSWSSFSWSAFCSRNFFSALSPSFSLLFLYLFSPLYPTFPYFYFKPFLLPLSNTFPNFFFFFSFFSFFFFSFLSYIIPLFAYFRCTFFCWLKSRLFLTCVVSAFLGSLVVFSISLTLVVSFFNSTSTNDDRMVKNQGKHKNDE